MTKLSKIKLIPLKLGDHVRIQDKTMASPQEAEVIRIFKRTVKVKLSGSQERVIHRKYVLSKIRR